MYGDMPFHLNIINSFLYGVNAHASVFSGFKAVFFADGTLVYPFLPDWHIAVLVGCGGCVRRLLVLARLLLFRPRTVGLVGCWTGRTACVFVARRGFGRVLQRVFRPMPSNSACRKGD